MIAKKPTGRPIKPPRSGQTQITILVQAETKRVLMAAMKKSGRTLSTETARWFEELETYRMIFKRMQQTAEEIENISFAAAAQRKGLIHITAADATNKVFHGWLEPGYPDAPEATGFIPRRDGEHPTEQVVIPGDESDEQEPKI